MLAWKRSLHGGLSAVVRSTGASDGDFTVTAPDAESLAARRQRVAPHPWSWLHQVHGAEVVVVRGPGDGAGRTGDGMVTASAGAVLAVQTADCAPVALVAESGVVGIAHAGWRGVVAGVIPATIAAMRELGAGSVAAFVGPLIGPECYEFSAADLARIEAVVGAHVASTSRSGAPALDLARAVTEQLRRSGVEEIDVVAACTACSDGYRSHRARGDTARQATAVWIEVQRA